MAGPETIHRIVEKIEVTGKQEAKNAFAQLGGVAGWAARALGLAKDSNEGVTETAGKMAGALGAAEQAAGDLAHKAPEAGKKTKQGFDLAGLAASGLARVVAGAGAAIGVMAWKSWRANAAFDDMNDQLTGLLIGTAQWSKADNPIDRYEKSAKAANAMLNQLEKTSFKVAKPLSEISALASKIEPPLFAAGQTAWDVAKATDAVASAAGVLAMSNDQAAASFIRMVITGRKTKDPFGLVVGAEAGIKKTDSLAVRVEKLTKAAAKVGQPVGKLAEGTAEAFARAEMLGEKLFRTLGAGIYEKVGKGVAWVVDLFGDGDSAIEEVVFRLGQAYDAATAIGDVMSVPVKAGWELAHSFVNAEGAIGGARDTLVWVGGRIYDLVVKPMEILGLAAKTVVQAVKDWNSGDGGFTRTKTLVDSIVLKMREFWAPVFEGFTKLASLALPPWLTDKVPILKDLRDWAENGSRKFTQTTKDMAANIAMRQDLLGMDPTTELGQRRKLGTSKEDVERTLKSIFGEKRPLINVENVNIKQDFRDQDPDRVIAEFVQGLERLGENAIQSQIGGRATALAPGG